MTMDIINTIGIIAGTLTTISFVPQVIKIWKTRSSKDVSLGMFFVLAAGVSLWIVYGIIIGALPVILANSVTLVLAVAIIMLKIKYK
jgi:MtN3 and saliva related transmembrane protein